MSSYFKLSGRCVSGQSLYRLMPADSATHLYRANVPTATLPETGIRESLVQLFGTARRRQQRQRALAWIFQHRGIA